MKILEAILNGLDERKNGETTIFYNCQLANEDETRGRKRALSPMVPLVQLRSKSHVKNLVYLNFRGDINIILTWIIMHFALCFPSEKEYAQFKRETFPNVKCIIDCWIQKSSTFLIGITQIDIFLLQKPHCSKSLLGLHQVEDLNSFLQFFRAIFQTKTL